MQQCSGHEILCLFEEAATETSTIGDLDSVLERILEISKLSGNPPGQTKHPATGSSAFAEHINVGG